MPAEKRKYCVNCKRLLDKRGKTHCKICRLEKKLEAADKKIFNLESDINFDLERYNSMHDNDRKEICNLSQKISELKKGKKYPCWIHVKQASFDLTIERLQELLGHIKPVCSIIQIEYGRY